MAKKTLTQRKTTVKAAAKMTVNVVLVAFSKGGTVLTRIRKAAPAKGKTDLPFVALGGGQAMQKAAKELLQETTGLSVAVSKFIMVGAYQPTGASSPKNTLWVAFAVPAAVTDPEDLPEGYRWSALSTAKKANMAFGHSAILLEAAAKVHATVKAKVGTKPATTAADKPGQEPKAGGAALDLIRLADGDSFAEAVSAASMERLKRAMQRQGLGTLEDVKGMKREALVSFLQSRAEAKRKENAPPKRRLGQGLETMPASGTAPDVVSKIATGGAPAPIKELRSFQAILVRNGENGLMQYLEKIDRSHLAAATIEQRLPGVTHDMLVAAPNDNEARMMIVRAVKLALEQRRQAGS